MPAPGRPVPAASLAEVIATHELTRRPSRPPDYAAENRALVALATALAENPAHILQRLAEFARELCGADSAAVTIVEADGAAAQFRWHAAAGTWAHRVHGVQSSRDSPCSVVLERDCCLLLQAPERHFGAMRAVQPPAVEALLAPFHVDNRPVGAVWVVTHQGDRRFDAEDARVLGTIARFASAAYSAVDRLGRAQELRQERLAALNLMEDAIAARGEMERATAALRESEQRLQRMVNVARVGVLTFDLTGVMLHANDAFLEMLGYTRADFEAKRWSWRDFTPSEHVAVSEGIVSALDSSGRGGPYEKEYVCKDGTRLWLMFVAANLGDGTIVEYAIDISARKHAEEALRASEEQFRRAIEDAPIPIIMHAQDGQVLQISSTWTDLTGYTHADMPTFDAWLNQAYGFGAEDVRKQMQSIFRGVGARTRLEIEVKTRSGESRDWVFNISAPGTLRDGRRYAVGMVVDFTERAQAEKALRESEDRLRQADHQKNRFLATLGHELRNPLAAIRGGVEILRSEKSKPATRAKTLPLVAQQVQHMEQLVDDLLDVARIVEGKLKVRLEPIAVQQAVTNAIDMVRSQANAANFELRASLPPDPLTVMGDLVRLTQIFVNLLTN
ncbi:MAG TPA: PAS domain S-box protein, partial [Opitutaceae bacterium]|nr:PAS domain S-box protein [Opitutaceae bacterium]